MDESLFNHSSEPRYNMKAVTRRTGIAAATLRAWERRYSALSPQRSDGNYRLYSERDIAVLKWLQAQLDAGLSISRAVALLERLKLRDSSRGSTGKPYVDLGTDVDVDVDEPTAESVDHSGTLTLPADPTASSWENLSVALYKALIDMDEQAAGLVLAESFALYQVDQVCLEVMIPVMRRVGEAWHNGSISVVNEHFASAYLHGRLLSIFSSYVAVNGPLILVGTAPGELHELGSLIFAILLRRHGLNVRFVGTNVPLVDLVRTIEQLRPRAVALAATLVETAHQLRGLPTQFNQNYPDMLLVLGGQGFTHYGDDHHWGEFPNLFLAHDLLAGVQVVEDAIAKDNAQSA